MAFDKDSYSFSFAFSIKVEAVSRNMGNCDHVIPRFLKADGVDRFLYQILQPVSTLTNDGPMEYRVISSHNECVVPSFIKLGGEIKIVKENGTDNTTHGFFPLATL